LYLQTSSDPGAHAAAVEDRGAEVDGAIEDDAERAR
jgi:hypothetical protein